MARARRWDRSRRAVTARGATAAIVVLATVLHAAPDQLFSFAGLTLASTPADARRLFPRSAIQDHRVTVATADIRDYARVIELPVSGAGARLHVFFERGGQRPQYPSCDQVLTVLQKQYGRPATVQEFDEERARNRRYLWIRVDEELSLLCFNLGSGRRFSASEVTLARVGS